MNLSLVFFTLSALEALVAFNWLALLPGGGLTAQRLGLLTPLALQFLACAVMAVKARLNPGWPGLERRHGLRRTLLSAGPLLVTGAGLGLAILLALERTTGSATYRAYTGRLLPLLGVWILLGLQAFGWAYLSTWVGRKGDAAHRPYPFLPGVHGLVRPAALVWGALLATWLVVALTGLGITPETGALRWLLPTVPLLEWQIWLVCGVGVLLWLGTRLDGDVSGVGFRSNVGASGAGMERSTQPRREGRSTRVVGIIIPAALYLLALGLWLSVPIPNAYFLTAPRPPNFEFYPLSDAQWYAHYAESLLSGYGYMGSSIPQRPIYVVFLALAFAVNGSSYAGTVGLQTLGLAFFPVVLYLLGRRLHSRSLGIMAALFAILHEWTSARAAPFADGVSTTKALLTDLPAALLLALLALLAVRWVDGFSGRPVRALLAGGLVGLAALLRTQFLLLAPVILIFWLVARLLPGRRNVRPTPVNTGQNNRLGHPGPMVFILGLPWGEVLAFALGIVLAVSPFLYRNWRVSGQVVFDDPQTQLSAMADRYNFGPETHYERLPDESQGEYAARLTGLIQEGILTHPGLVAQFIANHFLNNEICSLLLLAVRPGLDDPLELLFPTRPFWMAWTGSLTAGQGLLLAFNLGLTGLGIAACWRRVGWVGLLPLALHLGYNLSTAAVRFSGSRYVLPAGWAVYFYFAAGVLEATALLAPLLDERFRSLPEPARQPEPDPAAQSGGAADVRVGEMRSRSVRRGGLILSAAILLAGASIPLAENLPPRCCPAQPAVELIGSLAADSGLDPVGLSAFAAKPGAMLTPGRLVFPRHYGAGEGETSTGKLGFGVSSQARLVALLTGPENTTLIIHSPPPAAALPDGAEVIVLACRHEGYLQAAVVVVSGEPRVSLTDPDLLNRGCDPAPDLKP